MDQERFQDAVGALELLRSMTTVEREEAVRLLNIKDNSLKRSRENLGRYIGLVTAKLGVMAEAGELGVDKIRLNIDLNDTTIEVKAEKVKVPKRDLMLQTLEILGRRDLEHNVYTTAAEISAIIGEGSATTFSRLRRLVEQDLVVRYKDDTGSVYWRTKGPEERNTL